MSVVEFDPHEIEDFYEQIAENVKKFRKSKSITQMDLAYSIGHKSVSTIAKIEAGHENKHYNLEQLYKIAKVLDIDICEIIMRKTSPK